MDAIQKLAEEMKAKRALLGNGKRYISQRDLKRLQEEEYYKNCKKQKADELPQNDILIQAESARDKTIHLSQQEIFKRLRSRKEPITLFAETDFERYNRLIKLENREERTGSEFKATLAQSNLDTMHEILGSSSKSEELPDTETDTSELSLYMLEKEPKTARYLITVYEGK